MEKLSKEQAYKKYRKAIAVWQNNIIELTDIRHYSEACYFTGYLYYCMKEYETAVDYLQTLLDETPDFDRAWYAQYMVALCWDEMYQAKELPFEEAKILVIEACSMLDVSSINATVSELSKQLVDRFRGKSTDC